MKNNAYGYLDSHIVHDDFGDEIVIINLHSGVYFSLQGTGRLIWKHLINSPTLGDLIARIQQVYHGSLSDIKKETIRFLNECEADGLIMVHDKPPSNSNQIPIPDIEDIPETGSIPFQPPILKRYTDQQELLLLDPIHEVDDIGWPRKKEESSN